MSEWSDDFGAFAAGNHPQLWKLLGAHVDYNGCRFRVWAPNARSVSAIGDWSYWSGREQMSPVGSTGVWEVWTPNARPGQRYKIEIEDFYGRWSQRADPMATATECPPANASVICGRSGYAWTDDTWVAGRSQQDQRKMRIYEVHLGSWRAGLHNYRDLGVALAEYCDKLGFTHVELMPLGEYPFGPSWGYQVTGYYAPTARYGTTDDFRAFVDTLHAAGLGVILDWVPAHFPRDAWALRRFDGTALYEHHDPRKGEQPDWGTMVFNLGRNEVRNFVLGSALHWIDEYHVDGLRVDAVASMLYLDYSRSAGQWVPNASGGRENLDSIEFFRQFNGTIGHRFPGVMTIAEESTAWPKVTHRSEDGGLGFTHKWNMGWMNDTLSYLGRDPVYRSHHHHQLTFGLVYAFTEKFVLPLSHDEVVHGKGSLYAKAPGDEWQKLATLRALYAWMWALPGNPLLFMGAELAMPAEWSEAVPLPWHLLDDPRRQGLAAMFTEMNAQADAWPALWQRDQDPMGFQWLDADDDQHSLYAFLRWADEGFQAVAGAANFTPAPRPGYRIGVPWAGEWQVVLDTDEQRWGGSGYRGDVRTYAAADVPAQGQPCSLIFDVPPLAMVWLGAPRPD